MSKLNSLAPWKKHLKTYTDTNPNISLREAMVEASKTYKSTTKRKKEGLSLQKKKVMVDLNRKGPYKDEVVKKRRISLSESRKLFKQYYTRESSDYNMAESIDDVDLNSNGEIYTLERTKMKGGYYW